LTAAAAAKPPFTGTVDAGGVGVDDNVLELFELYVLLVFIVLLVESLEFEVLFEYPEFEFNKLLFFIDWDTIEESVELEFSYGDETFM